ncbi:hypothetical protein CANARDRAFT_28429 [[Candida] arabinofermentans NRRL YB-2248]|uniref:inorganic diphosphatase n=1 Tax=[Candida] arabinofermentans NRRL YB-2248 TaxID=983967 RepID=A0A1E4T052_9ASCO|nr:hypothetical protein CANARDRAFT_28429 [[Candida] arabinofermentans NRRL YB-2248]
MILSFVPRNGSAPLLRWKRALSSIQSGSIYTSQFKSYLKLDNGEIGSFFHDAPLNLDRSNRTATMICEIPRWSSGKFEISTQLLGNPIVQDSKKGKLRFIDNIYPHKGYPHNYGAFPQTWEDPTEASEITPGLKLKGDNDPLDVIDIGNRLCEIGEIKQVKILGSLALIDDGELDWKIIAIDVRDERADQLLDIGDVESKMPRLLEDLRVWFKNYKLPTGKPVNEFAFDGAYKDAAFTMNVIEECAKKWKSLVNGEVKGDKLPSISNATVAGSPGLLQNFEDVQLEPVGSEGAIPKQTEIIYYY